MRGRRVGILLCVAVMLRASTAGAFCRKTTCTDCPVDPITGCVEEGKPLAWPRACVSYALTRAASRQVTLTEAKLIAAQAFRAWQALTCPGTGSPPSIVATDAFGVVDCALIEYNRGAGNANIVSFRDDVWQYPQSDALGRTTINFSETTGEIYDADIEINATTLISTSPEVPVDGWDLLSIMTHEAGHFLGLAHSTDETATMHAYYTQGSDSFRTLSEDDIAGICAIYPPDRAALACDFTPRGGFASECALGITAGGCAMARGPSSSAAFYAAMVAGLLLCGRRRRGERIVVDCRT